MFCGRTGPSLEDHAAADPPEPERCAEEEWRTSSGLPDRVLEDFDRYSPLPTSVDAFRAMVPELLNAHRNEA